MPQCGCAHRFTTTMTALDMRHPFASTELLSKATGARAEISSIVGPTANEPLKERLAFLGRQGFSTRRRRHSALVYLRYHVDLVVIGRDLCIRVELDRGGGATGAVTNRAPARDDRGYLV